MFSQFIVDQWFSIIQTVGIIGGLIYTAYNFGADARQKKIANYIEITKGHRDIWSNFILQSHLSRVISKNVDLNADPMTPQEEYFVKFIIFHLTCAYLLEKSKLIYRIEQLSSDVRDFLSLPIPHAVWVKIKPYQNKEIIRFVERSLKTKRK